MLLILFPNLDAARVRSSEIRSASYPNARREPDHERGNVISVFRVCISLSMRDIFGLNKTGIHSCGNARMI
jgi:hypothetical protein